MKEVFFVFLKSVKRMKFCVIKKGRKYKKRERRPYFSAASKLRAIKVSRFIFEVTVDRSNKNVYCRKSLAKKISSFYQISSLSNR